MVRLSDYKDHSFGKATGRYMRENGLLARAVFVVDAAGTITYLECPEEMTKQPDYQAATLAK